MMQEFSSNKKNARNKKIKIVAEIGNTHEGSIGLAKCIMKAASECDVDAVKLQTHIFSEESLLGAPNPPYFKDETRKEYLDRTSFNINQWKELKNYAESTLGLEFISSPFSLKSYEILHSIGLNTIKIASGEVTNIPLLEKIAQDRKQVILSSGMSTFKELDLAVKCLNINGASKITILHCVSKYPCPPEKAGLNIISEIKERYKLPVGFSDHTQGFGVSCAAVCMGIEVLEKHFTLSKKMYGPDPPFSLEPVELKQYVKNIREAELAYYSSINRDHLSEELKDMKQIFEKSIVAASGLRKGSILSRADLAFKKPGIGISAAEYNRLIGSKLTRDIKKDEMLSWKDIILK